MNVTAINSIYLNEDTGGKGRFFKSRFLQAGLVKYQFGVCLLKKETIDKFVNTFIGCPVVINHQDVTDESAKEQRVGVISRVYFEPSDAWFWCEGVLFDNGAIDLVQKGYTVSCQYEITEYSDNSDGELHNGNPYDKEILGGRFEHLAIVDSPRYEDAIIAVNAICKNSDDENNDTEWITVKGNHIPVKKGQTKEQAVKEFLGKKKDNNDNQNKLYQKMLTPQVMKIMRDNIKAAEYEDPNAEVGDTILDSDRIISLFIDKLTPQEYKNFDFDKAEDFLFDKLHELEEYAGFKKPKKATNEYQPIIDYIESYNTGGIMDKETRNVFEKLISALKAKNEADDEKEKDKEKDDKAANDGDDKRAGIDKVAGILKSAGADEETIRTCIGIMEKLAYDKSEAGTADNKAKNEDEEPKDEKKDDKKEEKAENEGDDDKESEKDEKKEEKDDKAANKCKNEDDELLDEAENKAKNKKAKNSMDALKKLFYEGAETRQKQTYMTQKQAIELGRQMF